MIECSHLRGAESCIPISCLARLASPQDVFRTHTTCECVLTPLVSSDTVMHEKDIGSLSTSRTCEIETHLHAQQFPAQPGPGPEYRIKTLEPDRPAPPILRSMGKETLLPALQRVYMGFQEAELGQCAIPSQSGSWNNVRLPVCTCTNTPNLQPNPLNALPP